MRYKLSEGVFLKSIAGVPVLAYLCGERNKLPLKVLNASGEFLVRLLQQGSTEAEMTAAAAEQYSEAPETIRPVLLEFLEQLLENGTITAE